MKNLQKIALASLFIACAQASAFDFAISNFRVLKNGQAIFDDYFTTTAPPYAPNYANGTAASYGVPAGSFSSATNGRLVLNSAAATISPAVSTKLAVSAHLQTNTDPGNMINGLKPGSAFEVWGTWDAVAPDGEAETYFVEMGDWTDLGENGGYSCECLRLGVIKMPDGSTLLRFWINSISNDQIQSTTEISSIPFSPETNQQILLKLKKENAQSNTVTASYAFINDGVVGTEVHLTGSSEVFTQRGYAVAAFKASAPVAYAKVEGSKNALSMRAKINVAHSHKERTGNIYVAAFFQGLIFFNDGANWIPWISGMIPAYANNVPLADQSLNVLSNLDVSALTGATVFAGYGLDQDDLLSKQAYNAIYTVQ